MNNDEFIKSLKRKRTELKRKFKIIYETDANLRDTLSRKIELLNMLIVDLGEGTQKVRPASLKNLKHRARF